MVHPTSIVKEGIQQNHPASSEIETTAIAHN